MSGADLPRLVSIVVPLFNEKESLSRLHAELTAASAPLPDRFEFWFVDDGSCDGSWEALSQLRLADPRLGAIRFRRNRGKAAALAAGFRAAAGDIVISMDADLQDDPAEIPRFLQTIDAGAELVCGWKQSRRDPWHKVLPSKLFNAVVSLATGVRLHDHNCGYKAYRRQVAKRITLYGELHRYIPVLADHQGFRIVELPVRHRRRQFGKSKYGWKRLVRGFLDLLTVHFLTRYAERPMHLFGLAAILLAIPAIFLTILVTTSASDDRGFHQGAVAGSLCCGSLSVAMFAFGLVAELIVASRFDSQRHPEADESLPPRERGAFGNVGTT